MPTRSVVDCREGAGLNRMADIAADFEIPGVLWRRDPQGDSLPLVLDSPHSGTLYPEDFAYCCPLPVLRRAEDSYADELFAAAPAYGATLIGPLFPRSSVDLTRPAADLDPRLLPAPLPPRLVPPPGTPL